MAESYNLKTAQTIDFSLLDNIHIMCDNYKCFIYFFYILECIYDVV